MKHFTKFSFKRPLLLLALLLGMGNQAVRAQQVVLQGFWWDYWNSNYPNGWANYIADLAPRLKAMGIDAVWMPPTVKSPNQGNGYSPFDNYDLGDKYQKGFLATRVGNKDELLRGVAILHANGIDVVQDIVLNHNDGAGSASGGGGQDPGAWEDYTTSKYKNFRYVSYATPAVDESAANYLARNGRFSKNWQNFNPNPGNNSTSGDWNQVLFGPDISYYNGSYGQSSNATFNPVQSADYMRNKQREWLIWYKKQVGFDGVRLDAVKHFPDFAMEDFLYNLQSNAGWANGSPTMYAVGEWVGSSSQMDGWVANVQSRAGTFDFSLRNGLYSIVSGGGNFDIGSLPGFQQGTRVVLTNGTYVHRTVPFVNNHDTFRPQVGSTGNYTGWNTGSELAPHIDPFDPRLSAAYAAALAFDGSPQIFFEDLFNIGNTGKRYSHSPKSTTDLPVRSDIENLIWCHQNLKFKQGAYKVRWQAADHLVIERSTKAIIGINDNFSTWQNSTVSCDFAPGTVLKDYSGANGTATVTVSGSQTVAINTPPCNGTAAGGRRGYSVWAPTNAATGYVKTARTTTQEWELADDLGDKDSRSLGQGGQLPASSTAIRKAGRIYVASGKVISYVLYPTDATRSLTVSVTNSAGTVVSTLTGTGNLTGSYTTPAEGWYTLRANNASTANPAQRCFIKATYMPPAVVTGAMTGRRDNDTPAAIPAALSTDLSVYPNPTTADRIDVVLQSKLQQNATIRLHDLTGRLVHEETVRLYPGSNEVRLGVKRALASGMYQLSVPEFKLSRKLALR
ncbi:T9SS type A sorting domain-containing protein [Hymenobacter sp. BT683]|uniref:T9SS type A sorting domain-containing protein n=1 Tax=Hymenobacter jeongseonensis TaxID=2791027 RepID=A0ABS0IK17_9BACT|nr:alpha-amylase family glycosyl hydrolase [Hymenobacter jeongseonensis]MBF9238728.1 T9SS type A sorting domain-containing protein [Hymenobacter jeongseonensis]